jgi:YegS/Rv2252/BmrU family lipid kinase
MRRLFIVNPNAGKGRALHVWDQLSQVLLEKNVQFDCHLTTRSGEATEFARSNGSDYEQVIVIGGDGTVHETVNGIVGYKTAFGVVPAGTGNDFARLFNWSRHPVQEAERILRNQTVLVDLVRMQDRVFINVAGMGFDATVANDTNQSRVLKRLGALGYVVSVMKNLPQFKATHATIDVDGKRYEFEEVLLIAVGNAISYGGGMKITPQANCRDGELDICVVSGISKLELIRVFPQIFTGRHVSHSKVRMIRGRRIRVETNEPFLIHADGEITGTTPESFEVIPESIRLIV